MRPNNSGKEEMGRTFREKVKGSLLRYAPWFVSAFFYKNAFDKTKLLKFLPAAPVILEIGAANGRDSVEFRMLFPKAIIHCFEPEPANFGKLICKTKSLEIQCHQIALGPINGKAWFFVSSGASGADSSSLLKPTGHLEIVPQVKFEKKIEVDVVRLEDWLINNAIDRVDFLWIDAQGAELDILTNAGTILASVKVIHLEVSVMELYEGSALFNEVRAFLEEKGFVVFEEIGLEQMGDVVFIRKAIGKINYV